MRKLFYGLMITVFVSLFIVTNVYAESNVGFPGAGTGGPSSTGGGYGCSGGAPVAHAYRISLVYDNKDNATYSSGGGKRIAGTWSVDYYASNDYDVDYKHYNGLCGLYKSNGCGYNVGRFVAYTWMCTKQEASTGYDRDGNSMGDKCSYKYDYSWKSTGSSKLKYGEKYIKRDIFTSVSKSDKEYYVTGQGRWTQGTTKLYRENFITYWAMKALDNIFSKEDTDITDTDRKTINKVLVNSGYRKYSSNASETDMSKVNANISAAMEDGVVIQIEPVLAFSKSCTWASPQYDGVTYVGTLSEMSHWDHNDDDYRYGMRLSDGVIYATAYGNPTVYAARNQKDIDNGITRKAGIYLGASGVNNSNLRTLDSSLGVALFRVGDLENPCDKDLRNLLSGVTTSTTETYYNTEINKIKTKYCSSANCDFLEYSLSEVLFLGYYGATNSKSITCSKKVPCVTMAKKIYSNRNSLNLKHGATTATTYEDAIKDFAFSSRYSGVNSSDYEKSLWNLKNIYARKMIDSSYAPASCSAGSCDADADLFLKTVDLGILKNTEYEEDSRVGEPTDIGTKLLKYKNYIDWLYNIEPRSYLKYNIWKELNSYASCGTITTNCPPSNPAPSWCSGLVTLSDPYYNDNISKNATKCWQGGIAYYETGGNTLVGSRVVASTSGGGYDCQVYCAEKVDITLPTQPAAAKAGMVFKWGVDPALDNPTFAYVTINKKCVIRPNPLNNNTDPAPTCNGTKLTYTQNNFKDSGSATMNLYYEDPTEVSDFKVNGVTLVKDPSEPEITGTGISNVQCSSKYCGGSYNASTKIFTPGKIYVMGVKYKYNYTDSLEWYSSKKDSSIVKKPSDLTTNRYYYIGYGLPTSFTVTNGTYNKQSKSVGAKGELKLEITQAGTNNGKRMSYLFAKYGNIIYACEFSIKNQIYGDECEYSSGTLVNGSPDYCDPKEDDVPKDNGVNDIDVVFRTIKLINNTGDASTNATALKEIFPGRAGTTRTRGKNWQVNNLKDSSGGIILNEDDVINRIAFLLDYDDIYNDSHLMYKIVLSTNSISQIRKYNKDTKSHTYSGGTKRDPYTGIYTGSLDSVGYTSYKCKHNSTDDNYIYCASDFLTQMTKIKSNDTDYVLSKTGCMVYDDTQTRVNHYAESKGCMPR